MRFYNHLRGAICLWMAVVVLAVMPGARGQEAAPGTGGPTTQPATMRFKRFAITDEQGFAGMEVFRGVMPVDWTVKGGVTWNMALGPPDLIRIHWGDANDVCAFDVYPFINFTWSDPRRWPAGVQPGQVTATGMIIKEPPSDAFDAFDRVIVEMFRPDLKDAKVVNKEKLPEVAKAVYDRVNTDPGYVMGVAAGKETFEYELHGQTVQEVVSGIVVESTSKQFGFNCWSISNATSKRAPKGAFDKLQPINDIMVQSMQMNPEWSQSLAALMQERQAKTFANQQQQREQQQAQFNAIEARIKSQTAANDAQHQSYWQHSADLDRQSNAEADVQREVSPWKDSNGDTYKLPNNYGHAWSGADGTIIMNNDPQYDPNTDKNLTPTNWTPMQQAGN